MIAQTLSVVVAATVMLGGCASANTSDSVRGDEPLIETTAEKIAADPMAWGGKWVTFDAIILYREIESRLYANAEAAKKGWVYDKIGIGIQMGEKSGRITKAIDGQRVRVVGKVDLSCLVGHQLVREQNANSTPDADGNTHIVMLGGFCHTSDGPHLDYARVRRIGL